MATAPLPDALNSLLQQQQQQQQQRQQQSQEYVQSSPPRTATLMGHASSPSICQILREEGQHTPVQDAGPTTSTRADSRERMERSRANAHVLVNRIELSERDLEHLPMDMLSGCHVRAVSLSRNRIARLPGSDLAHLAHHCGWRTTLTELELAHNLIDSLPDKFALLANLQRLGLRGNNLSVLPPVLLSLFRLRRFDLSANRLSTLPPRLCSMSTLVELQLQENPLPAPLLRLSAEVGALQSVGVFM